MCRIYYNRIDSNMHLKVLKRCLLLKLFEKGDYDYDIERKNAGSNRI